MRAKFRDIKVYFGNFSSHREALAYISKDSHGHVPMAEDLGTEIIEPLYIDLLYADETELLLNRVSPEERETIKTLGKRKYNSLFLVHKRAGFGNPSKKGGVQFLGELRYDVSQGYALHRFYRRMEKRNDFFGGLIAKLILGLVFLFHGFVGVSSGSMAVFHSSSQVPAYRTSEIKAGTGSFGFVIFLSFLVGALLLFSTGKNAINYLVKGEQVFQDSIKKGQDK